MVDYKPTLVASLSTILPTYYEQFLDSETQLPCITYSECDNVALEEGNTIRISRIQYYVKLWGNDFSTLVPYLKSVDTALYQLGFSRVAYNELMYDTKLCLILKYEANFYEI